VLSLTDFDEVEANVGQELGVSDLQLHTRENLDAFGQ